MKGRAVHSLDFSFSAPMFILEGFHKKISQPRKINGAKYEIRTIFGQHRLLS